jgi:hypothetical protein
MPKAFYLAVVASGHTTMISIGSMLAVQYIIRIAEHKVSERCPSRRLRFEYRGGRYD